MADAAPAKSSPPAKGVPYIGLRPFERHESDRLFGRGRDAQILLDRTLSSRLTILYAQSGLGKSSLLRALVVPRLEESRARVFYFDSWALDDPFHAIKEALIERATALGVPNPGRGSPTLLELVRQINNSDDQSVVLVFDQFEEFLVHHAEMLDPLRSELAALVRAPHVDATVVLSLREEFLASLEPFREQILNLFQSAYRLEPLSEPELRDAIRRPAEEFGGSCSEDMTDRLIQDLRGAQVDRSSTGLPLVELPMLQLVCQELWKHAADGQLSLQLYEKTGGARHIIDDYVRELMPKRAREQRLTARLLVPLAPPSGLKMSFAVEDLSSMTGLAPAAIAAELERLQCARILRTRQHRGNRRYELEHDAFIPVLSAWRDHVLAQARRMRNIRRAYAGIAFAVSTIAVLALYSLYLHHATTSARFFRALSEGDPLITTLAAAELGDSRVAAEFPAEVRRVAAAAIPAAVLRGDRRQPFLGVWFSTDGNRVTTVSQNGELKLWRADGRNKPDALLALKSGVAVSAVASSPDHQWFAVAFDDGRVELRRSGAPDSISLNQSGNNKVTTLAVSENALHIAASFENFSVTIWNHAGGQIPLGSPANQHSGEVMSLQFDASGEQLLTASLDGKAKLWAVDRPAAPVAEFKDSKQRQIWSAALTPDGKTAVCGLEDGAVVIWNTGPEPDFEELKAHTEKVISAAFSPDGLRMVTAAHDRIASVWNLRVDVSAVGTRLISAGSPMVLKGHDGPIGAVAFSPDGSKIVTASDDGTARIWWSESQEPRVLGKHTKPIEMVAFSRDGKMVATASADKTAKIWPLTGPGAPITLEGHTDWVRSVAFSPDGNTVLTASEDQTVRLWDRQTHKAPQSRVIPMLFTAALAPDAAGIITGTRETSEPTVAVWSTSPSVNHSLLTLDQERKWIYSVAFSPDGSRIVTASDDHNARVWLREPGGGAVKDSPLVLPHQDRVLGAVFSPDGSKIATSSADRHVRVWDRDGKPLEDFSHSDEVWQIGFSSDGRWLVSSSLDTTARIWDLEHHISQAVLDHPSKLRAAAFRPGTLDVVTGADDGAVRLWRTDPGELLDYMRTASTACLTPNERVRLLGESDNSAKSRYAACEARYGR